MKKAVAALASMALIWSAGSEFGPPSPGAAQSAPSASAAASNIELIGHDDLQGRSAYQPSIHRQGDRFIAYIGHHGGKAVNPLTGQVEFNGTSIVDVTDPEHPRYLHHIPGEPGAGEREGPR